MLAWSPACDRSASRSTARPARPRLVLVAEGRDQAEYAWIEAVAAARETAYPAMSFEIVAPPTPLPAAQQQLLRRLAAEGPAAVGVIATDPDSVAADISALTLGGIPVITVGRDVPTARRRPFIGPSESEIGEQVAAACGWVLPREGGSLMLLTRGGDDDAFRTRYAAFKHALRQVPGATIVREVAGGRTPEEALRAVRREAGLFPRSSAWVLLDDWPLRALTKEERLLSTPAPLVAYSHDPRSLHRVRTGEIGVLVTFDYGRMVDEAYSSLLRMARRPEGGLSGFTVPIERVTRNDVDAFEQRLQSWGPGIGP